MIRNFSCDFAYEINAKMDCNLHFLPAMLKWKLYLTLIIAFAFSGPLFANSDKDLSVPAEIEFLVNAVESWTKKSYLTPNELVPQDMLPITHSAPEGYLLTVGTERGFISLAINRQLEGLVLIDRDPHVVLYNKMNIALLQVARNLAHYQRMRNDLFFSANEQTPMVLSLVSRRIGAAIDGETLKALRKELWSDIFLSNRISDIVNYTKDPSLFERLQGLANSGRISASFVELNKQEQVDAFVSKYAQSRPFSLIDISNAWWMIYAGNQPMHNILKQFKTISKRNTIVLFTHKSKRRHEKWDYVGLPLVQAEYVKDPKKISNGRATDLTGLFESMWFENTRSLHQRLLFTEIPQVAECRPLFFTGPYLRHE